MSPADSKTPSRDIPVVVGAIGAGVTICFAVSFPDNFYKIWEFASVAVTTIYALATWHRWFKREDGMGTFVEARTIGLTFPCYLGLFVGLVAMAVFISVKPLWCFWLTCHCAAMLLCAVCGCIMDRFAATAKIRYGMRTKAKNSAVFKDDRQMAFVAYRYADVPTIVAFALIGMFMAVFEWKHPGVGTELESFLAGAVSFQLIATIVRFEVEKQRLWKQLAADEMTKGDGGDGL